MDAIVTARSRQNKVGRMDANSGSAPALPGNTGRSVLSRTRQDPIVPAYPRSPDLMLRFHAYRGAFPTSGYCELEGLAASLYGV